jgi:DNA mismatch endonuclease (patch repair protein)
MADTFQKEKRSLIMKAVRSKGNKSTELKLIGIFKTFDIKGWRRNYKLLGNPDFIFAKRRVAVFSDGCFWHGHGCRNVKPKDNAEYWEKKIRRNMARDRLVTQTLREKGWHVVRVWECEIKKSQLPKNLNILAMEQQS